MWILPLATAVVVATHAKDTTKPAADSALTSAGRGSLWFTHLFEDDETYVHTDKHGYARILTLGPTHLNISTQHMVPHIL